MFVLFPPPQLALPLTIGRAVLRTELLVPPGTVEVGLYTLRILAVPKPIPVFDSSTSQHRLQLIPVGHNSSVLPINRQGRTR
jgi:hypothetical protein